MKEELKEKEEEVKLMDKEIFETAYLANKNMRLSLDGKVEKIMVVKSLAAKSELNQLENKVNVATSELNDMKNREDMTRAQLTEAI